jgi:hypothetical protein
MCFPPASYIGLACQDGYIALRWINFESYDNLRKISSNLELVFRLINSSDLGLMPPKFRDDLSNTSTIFYDSTVIWVWKIYR